MTSFILFTYLSYWFTSPFLTRAASDDLKMFQDLSSFRRVNKAVSESCLLVLQRHTWYVPVALFNKDLEDESGNLLAKQIKKPDLPDITPEANPPLLPFEDRPHIPACRKLERHPSVCQHGESHHQSHTYQRLLIESIGTGHLLQQRDHQI